MKRRKNSSRPLMNYNSSKLYPKNHQTRVCCPKAHPSLACRAQGQSRDRPSHPSQGSSSAAGDSTGQANTQCLTTTNLSSHNDFSGIVVVTSHGIETNTRSVTAQTNSADQSPMEKWLGTRDDYSLWMKISASENEDKSGVNPGQ